MFIFHILVYIAFAYIMYYFARASNIRFPNRVKLDKYIWWFIGFFTVICAVRWNVGIDCLSYIHIFTVGDLRDNINGEYLFNWLATFISDHGIHFSIGLGICAFVQIFFIVKGLMKSKYLLIYLPLVLFGGCFFAGLMNGVRQMMVACIFFYGCRYIFEKKPLKYAALIVICTFIHQSAIMLAPFYFIPRSFKIADKPKLLMTIFVVCCIVGMTPQFQSLIKYAESIANLTGYDNYADRTALFLKENYTAEAKSFGPMQLSYFLLGAFTIVFGPMLKRRYENEIKLFNLWYLFSFFYICAYFLVCNISHIFVRPILYFQIFHLAVGTLLVYDLIKQAKRSNQMKLFALSLIMIIWMNTSWDIIKNYNQPRNSVTYKTFFLK